MNTIPALEAHQAELTKLRRDIHQHPELAFEEHRTARIVAETLEALGIEVETGIAGTGVVGSIQKGRGNRAIGLRADLDALPIHEANDFAHASKIPG
ncbi:MAG: hippurate hydrolase, partial [Candidatus Azotimanducaceae bacterium]